MDRYDNLDLDLECEEGGGNVSQKAALFGGMFKKPKSSEASDHQTQDVLSTSRDISKSNDSLTDSNSKDKGTFKGKFKKTTKSDKEGSSQASLALPNPEMSASCESLENNKPPNEKLVGKPKRSPRPGHVRRHSQDLLDFSPSNDGVSEGSHSKGSGGMFSGIFKKSPKPPEVKTQSQEDLSAAVKPSNSNDNLSENGNSKEHGGMFSGMFKKASKPLGARTKSQEDLLASNEKLGSSDNLSVNTNNKESGGMFSGIFKKSPKNYGARAESKEDLSVPGELSGSKENLSGNSNTKESGGMFGGMFKKASKPYGARAQSQEDLSAPSELSGSKENLSGNSNTKESGGMFSGMFKKASKPYGARAQSQEDLSADTELSGSKESLSENRTKEKGGIFSGVFRKKVPRSQSQDNLNADGELSVDTDHFEKSSKEKKKSEQPGDLNEDSASAEKAKVKENGFGAKMKSTFHTVKQEKNATTDDELSDNDENQPPQKQSKLAGAMSKLNPFRTAHKHEKQQSSDEEETVPYKEKPSGHKQNAMVEAMAKLNPFRSGHKKDSEAVETLAEKEVKEKPKPMKRNMIQSENKERSETPPVPRRTAAKENTGMATEDRVKPRRTKYEKNKSDDEGIDAGELPLSEELQKDAENKPTKVTRQNPFVPWAAEKAASDDELLKEDNELSSREDKTEEEDTDKPKVRKGKKHNPFMPRVKGRVKKPKAPDGATGDSAENEGANMSVFDQLEEYRIGTAETANVETDQDVVDLMDWWNTVESWEDTPQNDDMTEKEEAKAFAVTAEKVQKGIRVFNKLFSERAECLWQHVIDLNALADSLDKFNKNTKIAQITGGSTSAIGGVCTITGLALAPVTMGTSLIVTAIGLGIATAGGLTSAGAGISNQVNNSMDRKKVEKIVEDYQEKIGDLNKCLKFIKQGIENLRRFDLIKMKNNAYNQDFPALTSSFYEDGAMAGKAILINANEIMRVVQIANVAGSTAARAVQIASMATGVLTGLFVGMDIYFVAKDSKILKKGAKSEFAAKIREVATQLHDGLVELNTIREELQSTSSDNSSKDNEIEAMDADKKETDDKQYSSDEDEIDRIKKAMKKDYENREYV